LKIIYLFEKSSDKTEIRNSLRFRVEVLIILHNINTNKNLISKIKRATFIINVALLIPIRIRLYRIIVTVPVADCA
jgi:hypothetical protein